MTGKRRSRLNDNQIQERLPQGWTAQDGHLQREFTFSTYQAGVDFTVQVAALAERQDHHPDIVLQYRRVTVAYTTHDAGGLTDLDLHAAEAVNALRPT